MKKSRLVLLIVIVLTAVIYSCSDDNSPGVNNNGGGGTNNNGCAGGPSTVTDIDGNVYNVVSIGNQCWMKENLKTTRYKNGVAIPTGLSDAQWQATTNGAYAVYNDSAKYDSIYGKLYNWYAVSDPQGLCPTGWHEPEDWEWNVLVKTIDPNADTACNINPPYGCFQSQLVGGIIKEIGLSHWASPNIGANDSIGFLGLPGGFRDFNGLFGNLGYNGCWWSATQSSLTNAFLRNLSYYHSNIYRIDYDKLNGYSIRCVRD